MLKEEADKETKRLEEEGNKLRNRWELANEKIQGLKIDAITEQYNSFLDRKEKFDHQRDEKLRTFFQCFIVDTTILICCTFAHLAPKLGPFYSLILALTIFTGVIFLAMSVHLCISIWELKSTADNLETERAGLESDFKAEEDRTTDQEVAQIDPNAATKAKTKKICLQKVNINFKPLAVTGGFILVATIAYLVTQTIILFSVFKAK